MSSGLDLCILPDLNISLRDAPGIAWTWVIEAWRNYLALIVLNVVQI